MATKTAQENWKAKKRAAGFRDVLAWLTPEAATALDTLRSTSGASVNAILSTAVVQLARDGGPVLVAPNDDDLVAELLERVAALSARVDRLESGVAPDGRAPKVRAKRGTYDQDMLLNAIADRFERDGKEANLSELYRELDAQGVPIYSQFSNFWNMYKSRRADVDAILQQRKDDRDAGGVTCES